MTLIKYKEKIRTEKINDLENIRDNIKIDIYGIVQSFINEKRIDEDKNLISIKVI